LTGACRFGGLISYGVSSLKHPPITQWRILFLIEGIPSFIIAVVVFFFLPSRPQTSRYLTEDQRTLALTRLNRKNLGEGNTGIDWKAVKRALMDWKTYVVAVMYSCMNLGLGSVTGFLPTIVKGLGYSSANAQLYTGVLSSFFLPDVNLLMILPSSALRRLSHCYAPHLEL
jgi:cyanate permease